MASIFRYVSYGELIRLIIVLTIDGIEYIIPILLTPFVGDIYDVVGLVIALYIFGWVGLFSALELVPALDILPINTVTWVIWIISRRLKDIKNAHDRSKPFILML